MELLNGFLDVADTLLTVVGWVVFWYTWVAPPGGSAPQPPRSSSPPDDLDQFLRSAAAKHAGDGLA